MLEEPGSGARPASPGARRRAWLSVALLAEARAAVAAARRRRRIDDHGYVEAVETFDAALAADRRASSSPSRLRCRAGELAERCALRGYDAIHLASAEAILDEGDVMVVSDTRLAEAAASIGIEALVPAEA